MKVLYISDKVEGYGSGNSLKAMIEFLSMWDVEPEIITQQEGTLFAFAKEHHFPCHVISMPSFYLGSGVRWRQVAKAVLRPVLMLLLYFNTKKAIKRIEQVVDFSNIDIIHTNLNRDHIGAILAKKHSIPHVWHIREFGELDYNCKSLIPNYISFMNKHTSIFIAISDAVKKYWIEKGLDKNKIIKVYNGVSDVKYPNRKKGTKTKCVFAGSISENKGQIQLIKAVSMLPQQYKEEIQVDYYGSGRAAYMKKLKELAEENKIGDIVSFKGYDAKVVEKLGDYNVGIMCSKAEGFGRTTAEYMIAGLCVIASDTGANPELIQDGKCGLIYRYGDTEELADKLMYVMDHPDISTALALAGQKRAEENFRAITNAEEVHKVYEMLTCGT